MSEDWRLRGQEDYLASATLTRSVYRAQSADWEHDHCEFCWTKFMDPSFSPAHARFIHEHPEVLTEGYSASRGDLQAYWWICPRCAEDFAVRFGWILIG